jgi:hypothetical protein
MEVCMTSVAFFNQFSQLKEKFRNFFTHKKKVTALDNYSTVVPIKHKDYLVLIKKCLSSGFLGHKEADFLSYLIDKYFGEENFIDWTHRTRWLKSEMLRLSNELNKTLPVQQNLFDMSKFQTSRMPIVPVEILVPQRKHFIGKRV